MILLWILALGLAAVAQLASLLASSKFAIANAPDLGTVALPATDTAIRRNASAADPGWTAFMRGM